MNQLGNTLSLPVPQFSCVQNRGDHDNSIRLVLSPRQVFFWPPTERGLPGVRWHVVTRFAQMILVSQMKSNRLSTERKISFYLACILVVSVGVGTFLLVPCSNSLPLSLLVCNKTHIQVTGTEEICVFGVWYMLCTTGFF